MQTSIYKEKMVEPTDKMLAHDLGETKALLDKIASFISEEYGHFKPEWKFYNQKSGWTLKMLTKKRNVLFMTPLEGYFRLAFVFGEKACEMVYASDVPDSIKKELFEARKYAEGRDVSMDVRTEEDLSNVLKLIRIKLAN